MSPKLMMFAAFAMIGCTFVSYIMGGLYFSSNDVAILNSLTAITTINIFGLFPLPVPNLNFFTVGLPRLILWDYPFFGGAYQIFQYMLYAVSIGIVWGVFIVTVTTVSGFFYRR